MLKHCAADRKRRLSALPNVCPYIYTTLKFLALQGAPYIHDISRLWVNKVYGGFISVNSVDCKVTKWRNSEIELVLDFCMVVIINEAGCKNILLEQLKS
jgi:hypothetical protein